ncbi:monocarboxylate transporter 10-like [Saccoglossus kowalevskii]|uniref:Monocarboxylate transporter 10-like n=1 Tax=Saccoglossus kowalevskii TaxID=10224 RepID=A0ABM0M577_SACKO|nr:PREDICTED: monocarboxylate transporter 10-like [Saccoglossus kowalevskii]
MPERKIARFSPLAIFCAAQNFRSAFVGSLSCGFMLLFSPIASLACARYGHRAVSVAGCVVCVIGLASSSFANGLAVLFFTHSILFGIGSSFPYTVAIISSGQYFLKHRCLATGISLAGVSVGTLMMTPLTQFLVTHVGWRNAFRIEATMMLLALVASFSYRSVKECQRLLLPSESIQNSPLKKFISDTAIWKDRVFWIWTTTISLVFLGYYVPYVHLVKYAEMCGFSAGSGAWLMCYLGLATTIARIIFGKLCDVVKVNRIYSNQICMLTSGVVMMLFPLATRYGWLVALVVLYGLADGLFISLLPILTQDLVGVNKMTKAWGSMLVTTSVAFMLGPPIAGCIFDSETSYNTVFYMFGSCVVAGALILCLVPWAKKTGKLASVTSMNLTLPTERVTSFENPNYHEESESGYDAGILATSFESINSPD